MMATEIRSSRNEANIERARRRLGMAEPMRLNHEAAVLSWRKNRRQRGRTNRRQRYALEPFKAVGMVRRAA